MSNSVKEQIQQLNNKQLCFMLKQIYFDISTPELEKVSEDIEQLSTSNNIKLDLKNIDWEETEFLDSDSELLAELIVDLMVNDPDLLPIIEKALKVTRKDTRQDLGILSFAVGLSLVWLVVTSEIKFEYKGLKIHKKGLSEKNQTKAIETLGKVADAINKVIKR